MEVIMVNQGRVVIVWFAVLCLLSEPASGQSGQSLSSWSERLALLKLRSSLGLRSKDWPIKADPCSNWRGIQCQNGRVAGINVSGFRRTRIARQNPQFSVDALANFSSLSYFNASRFLLPGSIPEWFGQRLVSLQVLDVRFCSIVGAIPFSIGNLTNLTSLYLSDNRLTGIVPVSLAQLSRLSLLDLSQNLLTGFIPVSLASLKNLTFLDMSSNVLSGPIPSAFGTVLKLQHLNLSHNDLSSSIPAQFGDLSALIVLDLSHNSLSGSLSMDLRRLKNLKKMFVGSNLLTGSLPDNLFPGLTQLQFIGLNDNGFTGHLPGVLWSMPQLHFLDVSRNNFTGSVSNLSLNANATVFNLSHNMFYGGLTIRITGVSSIDLSGNYFQGMVPHNTITNVSLESNCLQHVPHQRRGTECASFYAERGLAFDNFGLPNVAQPPLPKPENKHRRMIIIVAVVVGTLGLIGIIAFTVFLTVHSCRRGATSQGGTGVRPAPAVVSQPSPGVPFNFLRLGEAFTYQQILQATCELSEDNLLKHGHSGDLFRGILEGGIPVVVKKVVGTVKREPHMSELEFFSKVSHSRMVPLLGHCLGNENEKFIVYKHMPNGDLSNTLFSQTNSDDDGLQSLDWITRLKIAIGAAEGLSYLHHECDPPLVHRDVQASSILLDDKFEVRLGSLSEVCSQEADIHQSRLTRLLRLSQTSEQGTSGIATATCSYDVYCFGKVLLELVTGKLGISACTDTMLKDWLEGILPYISIYDKELVMNIIDPSLIIDEDLLEEVWAMAIVARSCLNPKPSRRPLMRYILKALENPLKVVREESTGSARLRATSSRGSWNAAVFGSWRHSSSDTTALPLPMVATANKAEGSGLKRSGTSGSGGSGNNGEGGNSSSNRRQSRDIFPEPLDVQDIEAK